MNKTKNRVDMAIIVQYSLIMILFDNHLSKFAVRSLTSLSLHVGKYGTL